MLDPLVINTAPPVPTSELPATRFAAPPTANSALPTDVLSWSPPPRPQPPRFRSTGPRCRKMSSYRS